MIPDILTDAVTFIGDYEKKYPDTYGPVAPELEKVKFVMLAMKEYLENESADIQTPEKAARRQRLLEAIGRLEVSEILTAYKELTKERAQEFIKRQEGEE
jgi:hypothetical protein